VARCCYCFAILSLLLSSGFTCTQSVTIATGEWPPFTDSNAEDQGLALAIIEEALQLFDVDPVFHFLSWSKAYTLASQGQYSATAPWSYTEDRAHNFYYSDAVLDHPIVFFHLKKLDLYWSQLEDLQNMVIGATAGQAYGGGFESLEKDKILSVVRFDSNIKSLNNLYEGSIDLFPSDVILGYFLIHENFNNIQINAFTHTSNTVSTSPTYLIISKAIPDVIAQDFLVKFNAGLAELKSNGRYQELIKKYTLMR
jgi:polar amino acid transport system substrate-binding protein